MRLTVLAVLVLLVATAYALDNESCGANQTEPESCAAPTLYEDNSAEGITAPKQAPAAGLDNTLTGESPTGGLSIDNPPSSPGISSLVSANWWLLVPVLALVIISLVIKLQPGMSLSPEDFSALSAERRMGMLHSLGERRKTLTELSKEEGVSLPTAKEHLEKLEKTGFVEKKDEGRKWKYYELTKKGKKLLGSGNN